MRRSICYCHPNYAVAGQKATWSFIYTSSGDLPKRTSLKFELLSKGRPSDWELPQLSSKDANTIWAKLPNGKVLKPTQEDTDSYEFQLPTPIKTGENFSIFLGSPTLDPEKGNVCQKIVQRKRLFHLYIDPKGEGNYKEPEVFALDVKGNVIKNLRIITPSIVARNKRFDVIVRFEDEFGNLSNNAPEGTLIDLSYDHLRENLNWKLFVPETGFINLPNLYFNEPGVYKIKLKNLATGDTFFSCPIKCFAETDVSLFWGILHGESEKFDASENIENCLKCLRDEDSLQFFASSPFDSEEETPPDLWKAISHHIAEFNEDERFTALLGFQWLGDPKVEGLRHFIYAKDGKPLLRKKDLKNNSLKKIYKSIPAKDLISIPSFTMGDTSLYNFEDFHPEFERVVEIYNAWGSSECSSKEGNLYPISSTKGIVEKVDGSIQKALLNNCRFGFVAGGFDDRGIYSDCFDTDQVQYTPGLTAIFAKEQTRESLMEALYNRSCYATTGVRMIVGFSIAEMPMGSELDSLQKPGLEWIRYISAYVIGTKPLEEVSIIRNGKVLKSFTPKNEFSLEFVFEDTELLSTIALKGKEGKPPFAYYYLRAVQEDGHVAWSSPIWIDMSGESAPTKAKKKK